MECRYTYTAREHVTAVGADRRLKLARTIVFCVLGWLFFTLAFGADTDDAGTIVGPALALMVLFLTPVWNIPSFLRFYWNVHYNQPMVYVLEADGLTMQTPLMGQSASWATIGHAGETDSGFLLYWGKSRAQYHWLPKTGFASQHDVVSCRNLILMKVRKFKHAVARRSITSRVIPRRSVEPKIS